MGKRCLQSSEWRSVVHAKSRRPVKRSLDRERAISQLPDIDKEQIASGRRGGGEGAMRYQDELPAEFRGALWLVVGELAKVIVETVDAAAVVAGPEGGFANAGAAGGDHVDVIVSHATDHVAVRLDVAHVG